MAATIHGLEPIVRPQSRSDCAAPHEPQALITAVAGNIE